MNGNITNLSSSTHQEIHKIFKDEIVPIVNQDDARVQNFENHFVKEAAKFVRDFKSLAKEADDSLYKIKVLEIENYLLLKTVVSQDIMSIVQNNSVVDTFDLQIELDQTKEKLESCIIKKEKEYATLWNDCINTQCASNTLDHLSQKLEDENVPLEFQVKTYAKENAHLKTTYKNLFDSINVTRAETKGITDSLQNKLNDMIYKNMMLRALLFDKVSKQKNTTKGVNNTAKTRRPQPRSNTNNDSVPSTSKSSGMKNKEVEVEEHHRNLLRIKDIFHLNVITLSLLFGMINLKLFVETIQQTFTINLHEMAFTSPICLMAHAISTKSWLWHQRLSHLNFDTINDLAKNDLVTGLPKLRYHKEHLCPSCEKVKTKKAPHPPKPVPNSTQRLHLLHMDLCGPMRVTSINEKRYVLVIVDDYSCYTCVHFLRSKDDAPEEIKTFLKKITILLQAPVIIVRTKNGIEFKNQVLQEYFKSVGISHQASTIRTPQQNGVV
ncbi:retrovirus-related pol polyprotein from transposon TNT 1-94 [Tanacetum coccineum]